MNQLSERRCFAVVLAAGQSRRFGANKQLQELDGQPHLQTPDVDNYGKALLDALFKDDSHVWSVWLEKRWRRYPGIQVEALCT